MLKAKEDLEEGEVEEDSKKESLTFGEALKQGCHPSPPFIRAARNLSRFQIKKEADSRSPKGS